MCGANEALSKLEFEKYPAFFFNSKKQSFLQFTGTNNPQSLINFIIQRSSKELLSFDAKGELRTPDEQGRLKKVLNKRALDGMNVQSLDQQTVGFKTEL